MKNFLFLTILLVLATSCGQTLCDGLIDNAENARNNYISNPTNANCVSYQASILNLLADSTCTTRNRIDYRAIYQQELDSLNCSTTCNNGIQDGDEAGIDCGGSICSPCINTNPLDMDLVGSWILIADTLRDCNNAADNRVRPCMLAVDCEHIDFNSDGTGRIYEVDMSNNPINVDTMTWSTSGTSLTLMYPSMTDDVFTYNASLTNLSLEEPAISSTSTIFPGCIWINTYQKI